MACYIGETETSADTVAFTHALETPWDSVAGRSPLMELCRMVQNRYSAIYQPTIHFTRVGANPADTALAGVDYAGTPALNPAGDFKTILEQCYNIIFAMTNPEVFLGSWGGMVNSAGYQWRYNNAAAVRAALATDLSGLVYTLQEDWKPIILALRTALESLSGAEVESRAWTPSTLAFTIIGDNTGTTVSTTTLGQGIDPATVTESPSGTFRASIDPPDNDWPVDFGNANALGGVGVAPAGQRFRVGFHVGDDAAISGNPTSSIFISSPDTGSGGWFIDARTATLSWLVRGNPAWSAKAIAAMQGKTADWTINKTGPNTDLPLEMSAGSGTLTFSTSSHITSGRTVQENFTMPDGAIPTGAHAIDWVENPDWVNPGDEIGPKGCSVQMVLSNNSHDFCIDWNGDYHDD
jgi:hypothetical protein